MIRFVDPGLSTGVAQFLDDGSLFWCGAFVASDLKKAIGLARETADGQVKTVVERPVIYDLKNQKGDPNDLIKVALIAGAWRPHEVVKPWEWKGQVPKEVMHRRMLDVLTAPDRRMRDVCKSKSKKTQADIDDAICMGLVYFGRLSKP